MKRTFQLFCTGLILCLIQIHANAQFAMGVDISWLPQSEALGQKYYDSKGKQKDVITILKEYGVNSVRLRTWVNPNNNVTSGHCSQKETIAMAVRCKAAGWRVMIDFHYGDTWNSIGVQNAPAAWSKMTYDQMKVALYDYVFGFCTALKAAGVSPEWIQNGNEINSGICHPVGTISKPAQMSGLLNRGYDAMKAVFPKTKVIIHVAQPQGTTAQPMLDTYKANGGKWDVTGCSSYASMGNQPGLQANVKNLRTRFNKEIMMVEMGTSSGSAESKKQLIAAWTKGISEMNNKCEGGIFWWEPAGVYAPFSWSAVTFDADGKANSINEGFLTKVAGCTVTSIEDETSENNQDNDIAVYPNPSTGSFNLKVNGEFKFYINDIEGAEVQTGTGINAVQIGNSLASGLYTLKIETAQGVKTLKVTRY